LLLEPLGLVVTAVVVGALCMLVGPSPLRTGVLLGVGVQASLYYFGFVAYGLFEDGFAVGGLLGLVAAGLVAGGGYVMFTAPSAVPTAEPVGQPAGPLIAFAAAALVVTAWFVPYVEDFRLVAPSDVPFNAWFWQFLEYLGLALGIALAAGAQVAGLSSKLRAGLLFGFGTMGSLAFLGFMGFGTAVDQFSGGSFLGLSGAVLALIAGTVFLATSAPAPVAAPPPAR
jgi:hypothetical protein